MIDADKLGKFLNHLRDEAEWGLSQSHAGKPNLHCNASRQLRLIVSAINQFNGIHDGHEIGWAQGEGGKES